MTLDILELMEIGSLNSKLNNYTQESIGHIPYNLWKSYILNSNKCLSGQVEPGCFLDHIRKT